ncbi:MAG: type II toxin-antitoxin system VapC family toxin [Chloroflexi bacterium]|nr:type II toxin-antitoxin system VapC family toxin [Chloroflexota bacterium]
MRALLDTHTFLWWITDSPELSQSARNAIGDSTNELYLSAASGWEIAIKTKLGRLGIAGDPEKLIPEQMALNAIDGLPVQMSHALHVFQLPDLHRDPFDRILIAQCQVEEIPIITRDPAISQYDVEIIW